MQGANDNETPIPDSPTGILIKAAEDCLHYSKEGNMHSLIIRVTNLYLPGAEDAFFNSALRHARNHQPMIIDGTEDSPCDFLHVDDLALFLALALETEVSGVVHLAYGDFCTYAKVIDAIKQQLPGLKAVYTGMNIKAAMMKTSQAVQKMDWVPRHHWTQELSGIIAGNGNDSEKRRPFMWLSGLGRRLFGKALPWVEMILFGGLAQWLSSLSSLYATFRLADFWLLYAILIGSMHGGLVGIVAAVIACLSYGIDWVLKGNDLYLLLYNMDNWLPLMMYMLAGGLSGYMHDKTSEKMKTLEREKEERDTETAFLESMYKQASEDRSQLQKQVMRYRDSYGRIYNITQELDSLQPEQVFLSTLNVLEDTMQNHSVALYSRTGNTPFARLVVHSREMISNLTKSIDLDKLPLMKTRLEHGELFTNTELEPGYPAFCAPIMQDDKLIAMIVLWVVPFDQQTLYHQNLFNVVAGLVQSAMVRTLRYFNMSQEIYLENTHILADKSFRSALGVYQRMRKQRTSSYILLRVKSIAGEISLKEMDRCLGSVTRTTDLLGRMDDDAYFVLLPQDNVNNLPQIENRFLNAGLLCEVVPQEVAYA